MPSTRLVTRSTWSELERVATMFICLTKLLVLVSIKISLDKRQKRSRERKNVDEGDITYINEKVRMFFWARENFRD